MGFASFHPEGGEELATNGVLENNAKGEIKCVFSWTLSRSLLHCFGFYALLLLGYGIL